MEQENQEKRKRADDKENCKEFITNFKISKDDGYWMTAEEETDFFIEHYVQEIRLEVEKKQRCEKWVKDHFF